MRPNDILQEEDLLIQLGEELAEAAQAALKLARHRTGNNPTCRSETELIAALEEEISDVYVVLDELPYRPNWDTVRRKRQRWMDRMQKEKEN